MIRPDIFISHAESEGISVPLTQHLLELMAEDIQSWQVEPEFHIGLNLAAEHLQHADFVRDIQRFARRIKDKQMQVTLELAERSLIEDGELDDLGTGHCALSYLLSFPLDYLKIDRGFINTIGGTGCGPPPVLDAIINLCHKLKLAVLAQGVKNSL